MISLCNDEFLLRLYPEKCVYTATKGTRGVALSLKSYGLFGGASPGCAQELRGKCAPKGVHLYGFVFGFPVPLIYGLTHACCCCF